MTKGAQEQEGPWDLQKVNRSLPVRGSLPSETAMTPTTTCPRWTPVVLVTDQAISWWQKMMRKVMEPSHIISPWEQVSEVE